MLYLQSESTFRYVRHVIFFRGARRKQHCMRRQWYLYVVFIRSYLIYTSNQSSKHVLTVALTTHKTMSFATSLTKIWKAIASSWLPKQRSAFVCFANLLACFFILHFSPKNTKMNKLAWWDSKTAVIFLCRSCCFAGSLHDLTFSLLAGFCLRIKGRMWSWSSRWSVQHSAPLITRVRTSWTSRDLVIT